MKKHLRWVAHGSKGVSRRRAWAGVLTFFVLSGTAAIVIAGRAKMMVREILQTGLAVAVTDVSRGSYRLDVGDVELLFMKRSVSVASLRLTTNSAVNAMRRKPLPETRIALADCSIRGLHLLTLVTGRGFSAESMGCGTVTVDATVLTHPPDSVTPARIVPVRERPDEGRGFLVMQRQLKLPRAAPRITIRTISFPKSAIVFRQAREGREPMVMQIDSLGWQIDGLNVDPGDSASAARPLFSESITLSASNFVLVPDSTRLMRVGQLHASLTDSVVELRDVSWGHSVNRAVLARMRPGKRSFLSVSAGRVAARGIDVRTIASGDGIAARLLELDSLRLDIETDKRIPGRRSNRRRDYPQQFIANELGTLDIDTLRVTGGITLRERYPRYARPATLFFTNLDITAANIRHIVGRRTSSDPMTVDVSARLQGAGLLQARFEVPLDAPRFDMAYRGSLGPMDATLLNRFLEPAADVRITSGRVTRGIRFNVVVRNGVASGTITPLYDQLRVKVLRSGSHGVLGSRGTIGAAARRVASLFANERIVRDDNPGDDDSPARVGRIYRVRAPSEKLPGFLWDGLKEGLFDVIKK